MKFKDINPSTFFENLLKELTSQCPVPSGVRHSLTLDESEKLFIWVYRGKKFYPVSLTGNDHTKEAHQLATEILNVVDNMIEQTGDDPHEFVDRTILALSLDGTAVLVGPTGTARDSVEFIKRVSKSGIFAQHMSDVIYFPMSSIKSIVMSDPEKVASMQSDIEKGGGEGKTVMNILTDLHT
jgi:hypothetical protein